MAWFFPGERDVGRDDEDVPTLVVEGLDVFYGRAHALQSVSLELVHGVLAGTRPVMALHSVDLPMPLRPTTASTPCTSSSDTDCNACARP